MNRSKDSVIHELKNEQNNEIYPGAALDAQTIFSHEFIHIKVSQRLANEIANHQRNFIAAGGAARSILNTFLEKEIT